MKFKIDFPIKEQTLPVIWPSFFMLGSCFAENQSKRMRNLGIKSSSNPFGITYNPFSIEKILNRLINDISYKETDFQDINGIFSWEHHGSFKYNSLDEAVDSSNRILLDATKNLAESDVVILTLGTSLVYQYQGTIVANCHKVANKEFEHVPTTFEQILKSLKTTISYLRQLNQKAHIILTVSPVRHLRSGVVANGRSKATLLAAVHQLISETTNTSYFPSYEIFIDELRDYRFAKEDLAHPTAQAEEYIWERFSETYFSEETKKVLLEMQKYRNFSNHIPSNKSKHAEQVSRQTQNLIKKYPFLTLT